MKDLKRLILFFVISAFAISPAFSVRAEKSPPSTQALSYLPVQDAGRVKPFESFARESLQLIYGKQVYKTESNESREAREIVMTWMLVPAYWDQQKIVEITHKGLKDSLKLSGEQKYFSPSELMTNPRLGLVMNELGGEVAKKEKLSPYYQAAQHLEQQLGLYQVIKQGQAFRVLPPPAGSEASTLESGKWLAVSDLTGDAQSKFSVLIRSFIKSLPASAGGAKPEEAANDLSVPPLAAIIEDFKMFARSQNPAVYPSERDIALEVHLKVFHPFMYAWIFYLAAAVFVAIAWQAGSRAIYRMGWALAVVAFGLHAYGFFLRMYLTGRPPVSNMYESVVWVSFGAVLMAMILEITSNRRYMSLITGSVVGVLCLIIADLAPTILDQSLRPLEPVLRSNLWLTVHVLTITLSYSAFFLAWGLGNMGLGFVLAGERVQSDRLRAIVQSLYRAIQVGVVLLAAGIILGGVWADYSWGRFWGWDPKETWALIVLLGYLAMLHGRLVGWVKNLGMLVIAVVAFNLVIMAWYGVNYVLGAGLHTYGFGAGGIQYVAAFVILNLIYVGYVLYVNRFLLTASERA